MENNIFLMLVFMLGGYLLGGVSPAYLIYRHIKGRSILEDGDGNPGAANIGHLLGREKAIVVGFLDFSKGLVLVALAGRAGLNDLSIMLVGISLILGHNWPVFLKFKGGKGALVSLGVLSALIPLEVALGFSSWLIVKAVFKIRFAGALFGFCLITILAWILNASFPGPVLSLIVLIFFFLRMQENIRNFFSCIKQGKIRKEGYV